MKINPQSKEVTWKKLQDMAKKDQHPRQQKADGQDDLLVKK